MTGRAAAVATAATLLGVLGVLGAPAGADAATTLPPDSFGPACPTYGSDQICSGAVPSWDSTPLDVDVTLPSPGTGSSHPLVVMLHGFGNNKHEWESTTDEGDGADKWQWNSHWFARHGYYVLTYTARGFRDDGPTDASQPPTPATPPNGSASLPNGTIRVKSREVEIRDTQWLSALVAATFPDVDPSQVAVTGGSYGGGESWLQAAERTWTFPQTIDPSLPALELQVAVSKYPWTDLAYSLAPNGHGPDPYASAQRDGPVGDAKASYISALFALGTARGIFEQGASTTPTTEGPVNIPAWNARLTGAGDPYPPGDPIVAQAERGLTRYRSAYYQDEGWAQQAAGGRKVAVLSIQGWTDDLFEAVESFRMFKKLKALDPLWPVEVDVADVGHARAQNRPETWRRLNDDAWSFLQRNIGGSHDQATTVSSDETVCGDGPAGPRVTATTPEGLPSGALTVRYARPGLLTQASGSGDPDGAATDPVVGGGVDSALTGPGNACRESAASTWPGRYTGMSRPLSSDLTYVGLGEVRLGYVLAGPAATVDARVWDVAPDGHALLVTRGVFRLDLLAGDAPSGSLRLPLFGNHWGLAVGHRLRLDLAEVDEPYLRRTNEPNALTFDAPRLVLPTRQAVDLTVPGV